jgi:segregation and condensation protein B
MGEVARLFDRQNDVQVEFEPEALRIAEALVFAASEPLDEAAIASRLPEGSDVGAVMAELQSVYAGRGVNLVRVARKWTFRTAVDLSWLLSREDKEQKKLSRAAIETLAIIAYHQPVTRADIEQIRGVAVSKGALDVLMETGWVRMRGRRKAPGRPVTYGTTTDFLVQFGLEAIGDLPGLEELKGAGLFDGKLPPGFGVPAPNDDPAITPDEDPLDDSAAVVEAYGPQLDTEATEATLEAESKGEAVATVDAEVTAVAAVEVETIDIVATDGAEESSEEEALSAIESPESEADV